ncbi:MAG: deoxyribonuclease IV [Phycisphaerae bacterium]
MLLGSHLSIAGGLHKALERADGYGFGTVAVFVRNQMQWKAPPLNEDAVKRFRNSRRKLNIRPVVAHGSYLANLCGAEPIRTKAIDAVTEDLTRCGRLGIEYLVLHPGSHPELSEGIELIADALDACLSRCPSNRPKVLLETTAGQGNCIGHRFEHLAEILHKVKRPNRFGVCVDTAHVFAAGYDIRTAGAYQATMDEFDKVIGLKKLMAVHVNDSKTALGSRVDRHEHIGRGHIGLDGFRNLINDRRLSSTPLILETRKETDPDTGRDFDEINAEQLRSLVE